MHAGTRASGKTTKPTVEGGRMSAAAAALPVTTAGASAGSAAAAPYASPGATCSGAPPFSATLCENMPALAFALCSR